MFGKRTSQPGSAAAAPGLVTEPAPVVQPSQGGTAEAFAGGGDTDAPQLQAAARRAESYATRPSSAAADRLDALASRPRPDAAPLPAKAAPGPKATAMFDLNNPFVDWVSLANGFGVPAARATPIEEFSAQIGAAMANKGPLLIEAVLA